VHFNRDLKATALLVQNKIFVYKLVPRFSVAGADKVDYIMYHTVGSKYQGVEKMNAADHIIYTVHMSRAAKYRGLYTV
jgi:hypothetical protein